MPICTAVMTIRPHPTSGNPSALHELSKVDGLSPRHQAGAQQPYLALLEGPNSPCELVLAHQCPQLVQHPGPAEEQLPVVRLESGETCGKGPDAAHWSASARPAPTANAGSGSPEAASGRCRAAAGTRPFSPAPLNDLKDMR